MTPIRSYVEFEETTPKIHIDSYMYKFFVGYFTCAPDSFELVY